MVLVIFLVIFNGFDAEEDGTQEHSGDNKSTKGLLCSTLSRRNSQCHGQAASNQYQGIDKSPDNINAGTACDKGVVILEPVDQICGKEAAEHHDFSEQEGPHT